MGCDLLIEPVDETAEVVTIVTELLDGLIETLRYGTHAHCGSAAKEAPLNELQSEAASSRRAEHSGVSRGAVTRR